MKAKDGLIILKEVWLKSDKKIGKQLLFSQRAADKLPNASRKSLRRGYLAEPVFNA